MKKPNFFIVGAPKCGTTSLAFWLSGHPQIYMPRAKEPHFFNTDESPQTTSLKRYEKLFSSASSTYQAVGEASVWYLHSALAIPNIERYSPNARYIVCLRNPIDMAPSLHEQQIFSGNENVISFEEAWRLNDARLEGRMIPRFCREQRYLAYGNACRLGTQLDRLLGRVNTERVLPLLLDDVGENPHREYRKVLAFLEVEDDNRLTFPILNSAKVRRSTLLRAATQAAWRIKSSLRIEGGLGILNRIDKTNVRYAKRAALTLSMRQELRDYFRPEVVKLSALLERDLSIWSLL